MRESIGGTWLFGLVITFIVFFSAFLAVSVNYSKAFNVKNNLVDLLSKYEGNNNNARLAIGKFLQKDGYMVLGDCDEDYQGYDLNGNKVDSKAYYCIANGDVSSSDVINNKSYYRVKVFFRIDLPVVGRLTTFAIKGETETIFYPSED